MSHNEKMKQLRKFYPSAKSSDWYEKCAGQRVQIIKKTYKDINLEFGTEVIYSKNMGLAGLIGASPGASTSVFLMFEVALSMYDDQNLLTKIKNMIPWYNINLNRNSKVLKEMRGVVYKKLKLY